MSKRKDKAYKEAVKALTATVNALGNGSWQGAATHATPAPVPSIKPPKPKR